MELGKICSRFRVIKDRDGKALTSDECAVKMEGVL